ncbi:hypothetical protein D3C77_465320 [compost metagenome]
MNHYINFFDQSEINSIFHNDQGGVLHAIFTLKGQQFMCIDSSVSHEFSMTPAISLFVACDTEEEIEKLYEQLSAGGKILMPLAASPVATKFGWVEDKYGVSWQLNLPKK